VSKNNGGNREDAATCILGPQKLTGVRGSEHMEKKDPKANYELRLWLALFKADTEEELQLLDSLRGPVIQEAIRAYRSYKKQLEPTEA
jgi:hypothetical protein